LSVAAHHAEHDHLAPEDHECVKTVDCSAQPLFLSLETRRQMKFQSMSEPTQRMAQGQCILMQKVNAEAGPKPAFLIRIANATNKK
jgi:hypothetical protein